MVELLHDTFAAEPVLLLVFPRELGRAGVAFSASDVFPHAQTGCVAVQWARHAFGWLVSLLEGLFCGEEVLLESNLYFQFDCCF
jgi:hypothetical protein